ncbi:MAG: hypothetical protein NT170_00575 [Candidatus Moranbacteria bacterium]|nr:hypothetical protein [Candidatus Moranbacteria bacterium]
MFGPLERDDKNGGEELKLDKDFKGILIVLLVYVVGFVITYFLPHNGLESEELDLITLAMTTFGFFGGVCLYITMLFMAAEQCFE